MKSKFATISIAVGLIASQNLCLLHADVSGWLNWRGPNQNGMSEEKNLPSTLDVKKPLWSADFPGMSTAVVANGKLYIMGYTGEGPQLKEGVGCFDAATGKMLWQKLYLDFLSDTIYKRYATSAATIDPETGNVYIQDTQGIFTGFTADGKILWEHSMMEEYGRLTFPNGRTASPVIDKDLVITRGITANWGAQGPGADRFYAFDKKTGAIVWASTPGAQPKDNSFSHPVLSWLDGKRVFYSATGDGSVVCANARTGQPIFRVPLFKAGINSSLLLHKNDKIIAIYGTPYEPGQMVALKIPHVTPTNSADPVVVERKQVELWSNQIRTSTSSPILVGDKVYVTSEVGDLVCVDANTGNVLWKLKLGIEQRNSSPLYADGKIYAPILNDPAAGESGDEASGGHGALYVIEPTDTEGKIVAKATLEGRCYGTPTAFNGKIYMQTTKKLYCWGKAAGAKNVPAASEAKWPAAGAATQLQIIPSELLLQPDESVSFHIRSLDKDGLVVENLDAKKVTWATFVPPTAKVKSALKGSFDKDGNFTAAADKVPSAGAYEATFTTADGKQIKGYIRGRVLPGLPIKQDFESFNLTETTTNAIEQPTAFAYPPLPWIGARFKFEVRDKDGSKALTKTVDNPFFRRATVFMGAPWLKNYTMEADVMSDGNKRKMSDIGVINQRYKVILKGNEKALEINSNEELFKFSVPFNWSPNVWYHLKTRVDVAGNGSGVVRAKVWKKGDPEPAAWTQEVPVKEAHTIGCPGIFGFSPQDMRAYVDNVSVTRN